MCPGNADHSDVVICPGRLRQSRAPRWGTPVEPAACDRSINGGKGRVPTAGLPPKRRAFHKPPGFNTCHHWPHSAARRRGARVPFAGNVRRNLIILFPQGPVHPNRTYSAPTNRCKDLLACILRTVHGQPLALRPLRRNDGACALSVMPCFILHRGW